MVQALHKLTPPSPGGNGRVERRPHDQLRLFDGVLRTQVPQELQEADLPRQVACAHATEHASGGLAEGQQARRPMLMPVTTRVLWLGVMDERVPLPLARPLAARRVGAEPTARVPGAVGGLLDRLDRAILDRLQPDGTLTTHPRAARRSVCVLMPPARCALLTPPTGPAPPCLRPAGWGVACGARRLRPLIRRHRARPPTSGVGGDGGLPEPPAPALPGPTLDAQLSGHTPRRTREPEEKRRQHPVRQRPLAPVEQGSGEVVAGALAAGTPGAVPPGAIVGRPPRVDVLTLAPGTRERPLLPPQRRDGGVTLVEVEERVHV